MHQVHHITKHIGVFIKLGYFKSFNGVGKSQKVKEVKEEVKPISKLTGGTNLALDNINKNLAEKFEKMKQCNETNKIIKSIFAYKERTSIQIKVRLFNKKEFIKFSVVPRPASVLQLAGR